MAETEKRAAGDDRRGQGAGQGRGRSHDRARPRPKPSRKCGARKDALRDQVAVLAVAGAEQILRREVNPQVHADLLSQLKAKL